MRVPGLGGRLTVTSTLEACHQSRSPLPSMPLSPRIFLLLVLNTVVVSGKDVIVAMSDSRLVWSVVEP